MDCFDIFLNIGLAFLGVVLALWYENLGKPRLIMEHHITTENIYEDIGGTVRILHILVKNNPRKFWLVPRQTAYSCHGTITFFSKSGKKVSDPMQFKWDGTPEPIKLELGEGNQILYLPDNRLMRLCRYIDIPPIIDEPESLAIALRIEGDKIAYGWTPESYVVSPRWKHPKFQLPTGEFIAKVKITTGDSIFSEEFVFNNPEEFNMFDLVR